MEFEREARPAEHLKDESRIDRCTITLSISSARSGFLHNASSARLRKPI